MALAPGVKPGDREVLERHGFKIETPYIEAPRCETCRPWQPAIQVFGKLRGNCHEIGITCNLDFGCVRWEANSDDG